MTVDDEEDDDEEDSMDGFPLSNAFRWHSAQAGVSC